ncbi:ORF33 [White spot syndrome virus]|uniref:Wsv454 n=3 Tax=White spot syndrome virus TaxID=342409 RepID=Q8VAG2_WSSVS|nr:wsv454 [Shrimp white spot syndrome virus]AFX59831.1 wsv454 [White spot syndrome virus]AAL33455.1 wsv454 [Shrimp white spot syndrome virus]AAL89382.1 WSSV514 [Shrimp white spot syndrome virus]ATU83825.1 ORF33 [White spot syndrome virus]AWQ60576.1 wsv454 [Shrimp white spot syndrome virus]
MEHRYSSSSITDRNRVAQIPHCQRLLQGNSAQYLSGLLARIWELDRRSRGGGGRRRPRRGCRCSCNCTSEHLGSGSQKGV